MRITDCKLNVPHVDSLECILCRVPHLLVNSPCRFLRHIGRANAEECAKQVDGNALLRYNGTLSVLNTVPVHLLIMSSSTKARVRRRPKAKSIAVLPHSLTTLNLPKTSAATECVDEDIDVLEVATSKKKKKLRKPFTREFKLRAIISMVSTSLLRIRSPIFWKKHQYLSRKISPLASGGLQ